MPAAPWPANPRVPRVGGRHSAGRFIDIAKQPVDGAEFTLDFNQAYNPPCAFSTYTTCPLPPRQNVLPVRIEAGEKLRAKDSPR